MAEMTLLEAARHLDEGKGAEAVGLLAKAARTVLQHAGDMKKLDQEHLAKETILSGIEKDIEAAKVFAIAENKKRIEDVKFVIEKNKQVLIKSEEEIKPALEKLAEIKKQVKAADDRLGEIISAGDQIEADNKRALEVSQNKLVQVEEAIKQAKKDIGAL